MATPPLQSGFPHSQEPGSAKATQNRALTLLRKQKERLQKALNAYTRFQRAVVHSEEIFKVSFRVKAVIVASTNTPSLMICSCELFTSYKDRKQGTSMILKAPTRREKCQKEFVHHKQNIDTKKFSKIPKAPKGHRRYITICVYAI